MPNDFFKGYRSHSEGLAGVLLFSWDWITVTIRYHCTGSPSLLPFWL